MNMVERFFRDLSQEAILPAEVVQFRMQKRLILPSTGWKYSYGCVRHDRSDFC
jgi:hypothetical protein